MLQQISFELPVHFGMEFTTPVYKNGKKVGVLKFSETGTGVIVLDPNCHLTIVDDHCRTSHAKA